MNKNRVDKVNNEERKVLTAEERLAFRLYCERQNNAGLRHQNAQLMKLNADLAAENAALSQELAALQARQVQQDMQELETTYAFLKEKHVLLHDKAKDEYFLKKLPPQPEQ